MFMNAVLAVALGITPLKPGLNVIQYKPGDYAGLIGRYSQSIDRSGASHLTGFDRLTGKPFDLTIAQNGQVEGTVGDMYITFHVSEGA